MRPAMAPSPPRRTAAALLLSLLLLLSVVVAHAARAAAAASSSGQAELHEGQDKEVVDGKGEAMTVFTAAADAEAEGDHPCGGDAALQEECLMRRTLAAHTDYIYTQGGGHN